MKNLFFLIICSLIFASCSHANTAPKNPERVNIILDTDFGINFDDVGSLAMLHAFADSGWVNIMGMISSNLYELSVPCIDVIDTYFGRPDIPIGVTKNNLAANLSPQATTLWTEHITTKYPHRIKANSDATEAVPLYRKLLSEADDQSVTICCIGFLTNLSDLLSSQADQYSSLPGDELIKRKVKQLIVMGGHFPQGREYNFFHDSQAAVNAINHWPTEIIFSGFEIGSAIITGRSLPQMDTTDSPVKDAYELSISQSPHFAGMSWDQTAVLVAAKGSTPYFSVEKGTCIVSEDGSNSWEATVGGMHQRLIPAMPADSVAIIIEHYMKHKPLQ